MQPHARTVVPLDPQRALRPAGHTLHPLATALADWQAHLDAQRIGVPPPVAPDVIAIRDANDALFRARARALAERTAQQDSAA